MEGSNYYQKEIERMKQRLIRKGAMKDREILKSEKRKGGTVKDILPKTVILPKLGALTFSRRKYVRLGKTKYFLDEGLGFPKRYQIQVPVKMQIAEMLKQKMQGKGIKDLLEKSGIKVSLQTIYNTHKVGSFGGKEHKNELGKTPVQKTLYINMDDAFISTTSGRKRVRIASTSIGREWDLVKKRWRMLGKRGIVKFYQESENLQGEEFSKHLLSFIKQNYALNAQTKIFGATDGDVGLKAIINSLPKAIPVLSKFHYTRNKKYLSRMQFNAYVNNNQKGIKSGKKRGCIGYSAESDVGHILKKHTKGRTLSQLAINNYLKVGGVEIMNF